MRQREIELIDDPLERGMKNVGKGDDEHNETLEDHVRRGKMLIFHLYPQLAMSMRTHRSRRYLSEDIRNGRHDLPGAEGEAEKGRWLRDEFRIDGSWLLIA